MNDILNLIGTFDQDSAIVALFVVILAFSVVAMVGIAILRSIGKWGRVTLFAGCAVVAAVWMLR
jgi:hypothetical protein